MRAVRLSLLPALALALGLALGLAATSAAAPRPLAKTTPGTPAQVKRLVNEAPSITTLPSDVTPPLSSASDDDPITAYPSLAACITGSLHEPACVFGDVHGKRTMVLLGDSHALMWFPALDAVAKSRGWRLVTWMDYGCPVADVTVWDIVTNGPDTTCPPFRARTLARTASLDPALVVVSEGFYALDADDQPITHAEWTSSLVSSLATLRSKGTKEALIGQSFLVPDPVSCLAAYPGAVQTCSRPEDLPSFTSELAADRAATTTAKALYVNEVPWTCSATCTVVIGSMIVYNSTGHLTVTYDRYLTTVLDDALSPDLR